MKEEKIACRRRKKVHHSYLPHGPSGISIQESTALEVSSGDEDEPRRLPSSFANTVQSTLIDVGQTQACLKRKKTHHSYLPHGPSGIYFQESSSNAWEVSSDDNDEPRGLPSSSAVPVQITLTDVGPSQVCLKRKKIQHGYLPHGPSGISIQESSSMAWGISPDDNDKPRGLPSLSAVPVPNTLTDVGLLQGKRVILPRIPLCPSDDDMFPFKFKRSQFPIRVSFAMTINKAQGQTIQHVGIYLPHPVFAHGHLYVALSRGTSRSNVKILAAQMGRHESAHKLAKNIVYKEVLIS